jgi:hypothetical protein
MRQMRFARPRLPSQHADRCWPGQGVDEVARLFVGRARNKVFRRKRGRRDDIENELTGVGHR